MVVGWRVGGGAGESGSDQGVITSGSQGVVRKSSWSEYVASTATPRTPRTPHANGYAAYHLHGRACGRMLEYDAQARKVRVELLQVLQELLAFKFTFTFTSEGATHTLHRQREAQGVTGRRRDRGERQGKSCQTQTTATATLGVTYLFLGVQHADILEV